MNTGSIHVCGAHELSSTSSLKNRLTTGVVTLSGPFSHFSINIYVGTSDITAKLVELLEIC